MIALNINSPLDGVPIRSSVQAPEAIFTVVAGNRTAKFDISLV